MWLFIFSYFGVEATVVYECDFFFYFFFFSTDESGPLDVFEKKT